MEKSTEPVLGTPAVEKPSCIPPKEFKRNEYGLICDPSVNYVYNQDGTVNWRRMIKPEYLVVKKDNFEKRGKPTPPSTEGLEDKDLLILLAGLKDLAQVRGYDCVTYSTETPSSDYVVATCSIAWIPNFETEGRFITFSAIGDAHHHNNTNYLTKNYLGPTAENRAFVRCVRNFLKIPILGQDEIGGPELPEEVPTNLLTETMKKYGVPFEKLREKLIEEKYEGAENLKTVDDLPRSKQFELITRIKNKAAEQAQAAQGK